MLHVVTSVQETAGFFKAEKMHCALSAPADGPSVRPPAAGALPEHPKEAAPKKRAFCGLAFPRPGHFCTRCFRPRKTEWLAGEEPAASTYSKRSRASSAPCHAQEGPVFQGYAFGYGANSQPGVKDRPDPRSERPPRCMRHAVFDTFRQH